MDHEKHVDGAERPLVVAARGHLERALVADGSDRNYHIRAALQYLAPGVDTSLAIDRRGEAGGPDAGRGD